MKYISSIAKLCERAYKYGKSIIRRSKTYYGYGLREVYRAEVKEDKNTFELYHYGTLIIRISSFIDSKIVEIGAGTYSTSDRDAINTVLKWHCLHSVRVRRCNNVIVPVIKREMGNVIVQGQV